MSSELLEYLGTTAAVTGPGAAAATVAIKVLLYGFIVFQWRIVDTFDVARKIAIQLPQDYCTDAFQEQVDALTKEMPECRKHCLLLQLPKHNLDEQSNTNGNDLRNTNSREFGYSKYLKDANENSGSNLFSNADTFQLMNEFLSKLQTWFLRKKHRIFKHIEHVNLHSILLAN